MHLNRRECLSLIAKTSLAATGAVLFSACSSPPEQPGETNPYKEPLSAGTVTIGPGTLTVYNYDSIFEEVIANTAGINPGWIFRPGSFQSGILAASSPDDLIRIPGLIRNRSAFRSALAYNPSLLDALKGTIQTKRLLAVDAERFRRPDQERKRIARGAKFIVTVLEKTDEDGRLYTLDQPESFVFYNWDIHAKKAAYINTPSNFHGDINPGAYQSVFGVTWNPKKRRFYSQSDKKITRLPKTLIQFDPSQIEF